MKSNWNDKELVNWYNTHLQFAPEDIKEYVKSLRLGPDESLADFGCGNGDMGNLMTLTAWIGLTVISWFEGQFLNIIGIRAIETILLLCLAAGVVMVYRVQKITVLGKQA